MSLTRPLTRPLTRALNASDITSFKYGGVFNPLSLNPYAFFDGESYKGTLENPTLDLDPSNPDSLDVITATRAGTTATYTDSAGLIQVAAENSVRVDHVQGEELTPTVYQRVGYTDFSSGWTASNVSKQSGNGYLSQPSAIITIDSTSSAKYYYFLDAGTYNYDTVYTGSFFIRRVSGTPEVYIENFRSTSSESTSISLTDDWQKIEFTFTSPSDYWTRFGIFFGANNSSVGDQVEIAMPQVEEGTTASDFVANTTGSPKFITGATYGPRVPMILVEPSATNLIENSEDFSEVGYGWNYSSDALELSESNSTLSPMGTLTADKISKTTTRPYAYVYTAQTITSGQDYTWSAFMKKGTHDLGLLSLTTGDTEYKASYDLTGGTCGMITGSATPTIEDFGNGWFRCSLRGVSSTSDVSVRFNFGMAYSTSSENWPSASQGDGLYVYIWGAQLEAGSVNTSYIPTSGGDAAARTRAADDLVISGSAFSDFFNASEGTFYVEVVDRQATETAHSYIVGQSTSQFFIYKNDGDVFVSSYDGPLGVLNVGSVVANQLFRAAVSYKTGVSPAPSVKSLSFNGTSEVDQPYSGNFAATNILKIGSGYTNVFSGHFRRIIYWPYHSDSL